MRLIESKTLGTAQASIEFTSIPQDGTDLCLSLLVRTAQGNFGDFLVIRPNSVSTGLSSRRLYGNGSSTFSFSDTVIYSGIATGDTATANTFGNSLCYIPNYTGSTAKSFSTDGVSENNATISGQFISAGLSTNTAAITSLLVLSETGSNLLAGSTISLYKITKGSDGIVTTSP